MDKPRQEILEVAYEISQPGFGTLAEALRTIEKNHYILSWQRNKKPGMCKWLIIIGIKRDES